MKAMHNPSAAMQRAAVESAARRHPGPGCQGPARTGSAGAAREPCQPPRRPGQIRAPSPPQPPPHSEAAAAAGGAAGTASIGVPPPDPLRCRALDRRRASWLSAAARAPRLWMSDWSPPR